MRRFSETAIAILTLFTSTGTLLCCALPALLVAIGAGAVLAGIVSAAPGLVWFSQHKAYFFIFAGLLLLVAGILRWHQRNAPCPIDPNTGRACDRLRKMSRIIYWISVAIYLIGAFFAYGAIYIL